GLEDEGRTEKEENKARIYATEAALARLEDLADEDWVRGATLNRVRAIFNFRNQRFRSRFDPESDGEIENRSLDYQRLLRELLAAERNAVFDLRRERRIDDVVMRRVIRDLDLEEARLEGGPRAGPPRLARTRGTRPALAADARSVRDPRQRGHAP